MFTKSGYSATSFGLRRGEALALRWKDLDQESATLSVRRSAGMVRTKGEGAQMVESSTKTAKPRVVDLDPGTAEVLGTWKRERGSLALQLARDVARCRRRWARMRCR